MIENSKNGFRVVKKGRNLFRRQDAPEVFEINASIYIFRRVSLLKKHKLLNKKTTIYIMPRERSVDIDDIYDFNIVKLYMKKMKNYLNNFSLKNKKAVVIGGCG